MKKILMASLFLIFMVSYAHAEYEDNEGYDENTEIRVKGEVTHVLTRKHGGPVIIVLHTASKTYLVITGPPWYLEQEGFAIKVGDSLKVTGSKFIGREGNVYIAARRIKDSAGRVLLLKDSNLVPFWRGHHKMRGGGPEPQ